MKEVVLGDNEIERLINGESIKKTLSDGKTLLIRQSYVKDMVAPIVNRDKEVFSKNEIESIKRMVGVMSNTMRL